MTLTDKQRERAQKLIALYMGGVGGEQEAARRKLESFCKQHGINFDDLLSDNLDATEEVWLTVGDNGMYEDLAHQILWKVRGEWEGTLWKKRKGHPKQIGSRGFTKAQKAEAELAYEIYCVALGHHFKDAFTAFIYANEIWGHTDHQPDAYPELSEEQREAQRRASAMANQMAPVQIHKTLEHKR